MILVIVGLSGLAVGFALGMLVERLRFYRRELWPLLKRAEALRED